MQRKQIVNKAKELDLESFRCVNNLTTRWQKLNPALKHIARSFRSVPLFLRIPTYFLAGLISFTRVYSGEHYPSDVLAGALVGLGIETLVERNWLFIHGKMEAVETALEQARSG